MPYGVLIGRPPAVGAGSAQAACCTTISRTASDVRKRKLCTNPLLPCLHSLPACRTRGSCCLCISSWRSPICSTSKTHRCGTRGSLLAASAWVAVRKGGLDPAVSHYGRRSNSLRISWVASTDDEASCGSAPAVGHLDGLSMHGTARTVRPSRDQALQLHSQIAVIRREMLTCGPCPQL